MSKTYGREISKNGVQDPSSHPYHPFPDSTNMGGVRSIEDPAAAFSC